MASKDDRLGLPLNGHYGNDSWNTLAPQPAPDLTELDPGQDPLLNTIIDEQYLIEDTIGRGAMAIVYRGRQLSTERPVALKRLSIHSTEGIMRFSREIRNHSQLKHPNIVEFIEFFGSKSGQFFLVMELANGSGLQEVLKSLGKIDDPEIIASIMFQLCDALIYAHDNNVVHRDLKSSNIILIKEGEKIIVKVLDFGIAQLKGEERITLSGRAVGSPLYMSPEQCKGQTPTALSDIYALGIIAYEILVGQPPYTRGALNDILEAHCSETIKPAPIKLMTPRIDGVLMLDQIILKCLEPDPKKRWQTARDLRVAFEFWHNSIRAEHPATSLPSSILAPAKSPEVSTTKTAPKISLAELAEVEEEHDRQMQSSTKLASRQRKKVKNARFALVVVSLIVVVVVLVYLSSLLRG
jgi:eukaryotic-like serine/threonine-protein kinase